MKQEEFVIYIDGQADCFSEDYALARDRQLKLRETCMEVSIWPMPQGFGKQHELKMIEPKKTTNHPPKNKPK